MIIIFVILAIVMMIMFMRLQDYDDDNIDDAMDCDEVTVNEAK